jgi:hypothetical protein
MFVDHGRGCFFYERDHRDMPVIEELVKLGLSLDSDKPDRLYMFLAIAYHSDTQDRSIEHYRKVVSTYITSIEHNKVKKTEWVNERIYKYMGPLVMDFVNEGFPTECKNEQVTLKAVQIMKDISNNISSWNVTKKIQEIVDVVLKVYTVTAVKKDEVMVKRLTNAVSTLLGVNNKDDKQKEEVESYVEDLKKVKLKLNDIQSDEILFGYYDGLMYTLSQSYTTAQVVSSGQVELDCSVGGIKKLGISMLKYTPLIGDALSGTIDAIASHLKKIDMVQRSVNVARFAVNQSEFDEIVQDTIVEIISKHKDYLLENASKFELKKDGGWMAKIDDFIKILDGDLENHIYKIRFTTKQQQFGNKQASDLLTFWISSGKIYNNKPYLMFNEKKAQLNNSLGEIFEVDMGNKLAQLAVEDVELDKTGGSKQHTNKKDCCCSIF